MISSSGVKKSECGPGRVPSTVIAIFKKRAEVDTVRRSGPKKVTCWKLIKLWQASEELAVE
jgi:hypothetical protein